MSTLEFPPDHEEPLDPVWWAPLVAVAALVAGDEDHRFFDIADFMMMARLRRGSRPRIFLYKHCFTRRYLNLDELGNAYRYVPPRPESQGSGQYRKLPDIEHGVRALRLWELPWLKPALDDQRCGLDWDHRVPLRPEHVARWQATGSFLPERVPSDNGWDDDGDGWDDDIEPDHPEPEGTVPDRAPVVAPTVPRRDPRSSRRGHLRLVR